MDTGVDNFTFSGDQSATHTAAGHGPSKQTGTGDHMVIDLADLLNWTFDLGMISQDSSTNKGSQQTGVLHKNINLNKCF